MKTNPKDFPFNTFVNAVNPNYGLLCKNLYSDFINYESDATTPNQHFESWMKSGICWRGKEFDFIK